MEVNFLQLNKETTEVIVIVLKARDRETNSVTTWFQTLTMCKNMCVIFYFEPKFFHTLTEQRFLPLSGKSQNPPISHSVQHGGGIACFYIQLFRILLQNLTARMLTKTEGREHILRWLNWLPLSFRISLRFFLMIFKMLMVLRHHIFSIWYAFIISTLCRGFNCS